MDIRNTGTMQYKWFFELKIELNNLRTPLYCIESSAKRTNYTIYGMIYK